MTRRPLPTSAGGQFSRDIQAASSKNALHDGLRQDAFDKNTLAKLFVYVDPDEAQRFLSSIGDTHVQTRLVPQLTGIHLRPEEAPAASGDPNLREDRRDVRTGYVDFCLQRAQHIVRENFQVAPTLEGNFVVYSFDQQPPTFSYAGLLLNTKQNDQASNFFRLYIHVLRLAQLAKRQKVVALRYDSYIVHGAITSLSLDHGADTQISVPFSFELLVKKILIVNYTINFKPTQPASDFSDDPNSAGFDNRPRRDRSPTRIVAVDPLNTEHAPVSREDADLRTEVEPVVEDAATPPRPVSPQVIAETSGQPETANPPPRVSSGHTVEE